VYLQRWHWHRRLLCRILPQRLTDAVPGGIEDRVAHATGSDTDHIQTAISGPIVAPIAGTAVHPATGVDRGVTVGTRLITVACPMAPGNEVSRRPRRYVTNKSSGSHPMRYGRFADGKDRAQAKSSGMADDVKNAPCILCARVNAHKVLARQDRSSEEGPDVYYFLACAGCGAASVANIWNVGGGDDEARYYPSPISRKPPEWLWRLRFLFGDSEKPLGELLHEIYEAVQGKQHRLALMGIRAFFEQLMIAKVGDQGTFNANLNKFLEEGFIAKLQRAAIEHILESGHARNTQRV
jgi:hypothetical protein